MRMRALAVSFVCAAVVLAVATVSRGEDKTLYQGQGAVKARQVADDCAWTQITATTTNTTLNLKGTAMRVVINNLSSAVDLYVNPCGPIAFNLSGTDGTTQVGVGRLYSGGTDFAAAGVTVGDFLTLNEGDENDGVYVVKTVNGKELLLDRAVAKTHGGDQDWKLQSIALPASSGRVVFDVGTQQVGIKAESDTAVVNVEVYYQK